MEDRSRTEPASSIDAETQELLAEFVGEAREILQEAEPRLVALEATTGDRGQTAELVSAVFRMFHTLKGCAGFLGLDAIAELTHTAESLLALFRDHDGIPEASDVDSLCMALDTVSRLVERVHETGSDTGHAELVERTMAKLSHSLQDVEVRTSTTAEPKLPVACSDTEQPSPAPSNGIATASNALLSTFTSEALEQVDELEAFLLAAEREPMAPEAVAAAFRTIHTFKGNAGFMGLAELERLAHTVEDVLHSLREHGQSPAGATLASLLAGVDQLRAATQALGSAPATGVGSATTATHQRDGEARPQSGPDATTAAPGGAADSAPSSSASRAGGDTSSSAKPSSNTYIRVDLAKLDALLGQVGELITAAATVSQDLAGSRSDNERALQSAMQLHRITNGLHDTAMAMRMVPLGSTFRKVLRVVRDVSKRLGKKVDVELEGEDTEVDKTVIEALADPLVHIVRNAVDHGIERPEARIAAGKPETGSLTLSARHQGGEVWITIADDGGGIDPQAIVARAKQRGLLATDTPDLPAEEAYELLFAPGFSTADTITDVSGRGVGMDVVRQNIESIRGRIEVASEVGRGSQFTVRIPLTLAIIDAMLLRVGSTLYAIPLLAIQESLRLGHDRLVTLPGGKLMARIRDRVVPILRMHELHKIPGATTDIARGILVSVEDAGESLCLFVDELVGQRQIVIKALDPYIAGIRGVCGCSVTGTGDICLILDVSTLVRDVRRNNRSPASETGDLREGVNP